MAAGLLILRITLGVLIIGHGSQKAWGWPHGPGLAAVSALFDSWGFRPGRPMAILAASCEILGGAGMLAGLLTPLAAAILIGTMTVAIAPSLPNGLWAARGGIELPVLYGCLALVTGFTGAGAYSADRLLGTPHGILPGLLALAVGTGASVPPLIRRHQVLTRRTASAGRAQSPVNRT